MNKFVLRDGTVLGTTEGYFQATMGEIVNVNGISYQITAGEIHIKETFRQTITLDPVPVIPPVVREIIMDEVLP